MRKPIVPGASVFADVLRQGSMDIPSIPPGRTEQAWVFINRLCHVLEAIQHGDPPQLTEADARAIEDLGLGTVTLSTNMLVLNMPAIEALPLRPRNSDELVARAAALFKRMKRKLAQGIAFTTADADELAMCKMGRIDVATQTVQMDPAFVDGLRRVAEEDASAGRMLREFRQLEATLARGKTTVH